MKVKLLISVLLLCSFVFAQINIERTDRIDTIEVVNCTSADAKVSMNNCRAIKADVGGIVAITIQPEPRNKRSSFVTVEYLPGGVWIPVGNVVKVARYYTGTTAATTQVYTSAGVLTTGIKVGK